MNPDETGLCYTYDSIGNLTGVSEAEVVIDYGEDADGYMTIDYSLSPKSEGNEVLYGYDAATNRLSTITTGSSSYSFVYDDFGNTEEISVNSRSLASYTYLENNGKLDTLTYGNGDKVNICTILLTESRKSSIM